MMKTFFLSLVFFLFFSQCLSVNSDFNQEWRLANCKFEPLPDTFDSVSFLNFNNEFHAHSDYFVNFTQPHQYITFTINTPSVFKIYVAPHEVDVDLYLWNITTGRRTLVDISSLAIGTEETIFQPNLPNGIYQIDFTFFGVLVGRHTPTECDTITVEWAIAPRSVMVSRGQQFSCPSQNNLPNLDFSSFPVSYDSSKNEPGVVMNVNYPNQRGVKWAQGYNFTIPSSSSLWRFEAKLGVDFFTGGGLGIMIQSFDANNTTPDLNCFRNNECNLAENDRLNEIILRASLTPGDYTMWIYDHADEQDASILSCTPFTFSLSITTEGLKEDFLTCNAATIPDVLIPSELEEPDGFVHYAGEVLLELERRNVKMNFTVLQPSFFRVYVEPHRVDIDLRLVNENTGQTLDYVYRYGGEEVIANFLQPGNYSLTFIYFGTYQSRFCETFFYEIAVVPQAQLPSTWGFCYNGNQVLNVKPDLSNLQQDLNATNTYTLRLGDGPYFFPYNNNYLKREIFSQNFTLNVESAVFFDVGDYFLLGDIHLTLYSYNQASAILITSESQKNRNFIRTTLAPGNYRVVLSTGPSNKRNLPAFPPCAQYTLEISIQPVLTAPVCWEYDTLPETFNTPAFLGITGVLHLAKQYSSPVFAPGELRHMQSVYFSVQTTSFFRIWTEAHIIDVDFLLYANGSLVASTLRLNVEEELLYTLQPGTQYTLSINYWHWQRNDPTFVEPDCFLVDLEFAISPVTPNGLLCAPNLPPSNFIPDATGVSSQFIATGEYYFTQTDRSRVISLPFSTSVFTLFRAVVEYDFVWSDVSIMLVINNSTRINSDNHYGSKEISTQVLPPGNYSLVIYEPATMTLPLYRRCVHFRLTVGWRQTDSSSSGPSDLLGCQEAYLPTTLNTLSYLGFTQGQFHIQRNILVDTDGRDGFEFTLAVPSLFSIYIPSHSVVDVDLFLNVGTLNNTGARLASRTGYNEESIYYNLTAGNYVLTTRYYGFSGSPLPAASACVFYPAEIAITPLQVLEAIPDLTRTCTNSPAPGPIVLNTPFNGTFSRPLNRNLNYVSTFNLTRPALFTFELDYRAIPSFLSINLTGLVDIGTSSPVPRTFIPTLGYNHIFISEVLPKGRYTLRIRDPRDFTHRDNLLTCGSYSISYLINTTGFDDACTANNLPTDLFSVDGGSAAFGGPQAADGSVRIYGNKFLISTPNNQRDNYILFYVNVTSYMRVFVNSLPTTDIDFYVYRNMSRGTPMYYSLGTETIESQLWRFDPKADPYVLDIYFFRFDRTNPCPTFSLEIAIRTEQQLSSELLCPSTLPTPEVPPPRYDISGVVWDFNDNYYFTQQRIAGNTVNNRFAYRITLNAYSNTTILASVGFDFLANDFRLVLRSPTSTRPLAYGYPAGSENTANEINFFNGLFYQLTPGQYFLDIEEDLSQKNLPFESFCHRFGFFLMAVPTGNTSLPVINSVSPPSGENLAPQQGLSISISFSQPVAVPSPDVDLVSWLSQTQSVYLFVSPNTDNKIYPINAIFGTNQLLLQVTFGVLASSTTYLLSINASNFRVSSGAPFQLLGQQVFVYSTVGCDCSSHGICDSTGNCVCDIGYAGLTCAACDRGFHYAGASCVQDIPCTNSTCNYHGTCQVYDGSPYCRCDDGYTSTNNGFCADCSIGYTGYPNCQIENDEESNACTAPLLPSNLDEIGYLQFKKEVHLRAEYYIDVDHSSHEMYFSLTEDSVFRLYLEPHWVDVDAWLYRIDPTRNTIIDYAIKWNEEEVIFRVLPGAATPVKYKIRFNYYIWDSKRVADCETFNMELAISPVSRVKSETTNMQCTGALPAPPGSSPGTYIILSDAWSYTPSTVFSVVANSSAAVPNYFYGFDFEINAPEGSVALFSAEIRYQFLPGDLAFLLEAGTAKTQCGSKSSPLCIVGSNLLNRNEIRELLGNGKYTLWIYEPEPQNETLSACSSFEFSASVKMVPLIQDIYYCDGTIFPTTFNSPGFLDFDNHMHIQEDFLLLDAVSVPFQVTESSFIRISGSSVVTSSFAIYSSVGDLIIASGAGNNPVVFTTLSPGNYVFKILAFFFTDAGRCPTINMEMVVTPTSTALVANCPSSETLPNIGTITLPFYFNANSSVAPTSYFSFLVNDVVRQFTFYLNEPAFLEAIVTSNFLTAGLRLELVYTEQTGQRSLFGAYNYNQNMLRETLDRGDYTLRIRRSAVSPNRPVSFPTCAEFYFSLKLVTLTQAQNNPCLQVSEPLPLTFNSLRFLNIDGDFDFHSNTILAPSFGTLASYQIPLTVTRPLILRAYAQYRVDLDLFDTRTPLPVQSSVNGTLLYVLEPYVQYKLAFSFWRWTPADPTCPTFNMGVAVAKPHTLMPSCPGNADKWPQAPPATGMPYPPYLYDSLTLGASLYFQQRPDSLRTSPVYAFSLQGPSNFYGRLGFDFLSGALGFRLTAKDLKVTYYGQNTLNGYELKLTSLPAGSYELVIFEPARNLEAYIGCSMFYMELYIESDTVDTLIPDYPYLPAKLDSFAFLSYDGLLHLHNDFTLFDAGNSNEDVSFTLRESSLVKVTTTHYLKDIDGLQINLYKGSSLYSSHTESLWQMMEAGSYRLNFRRPYQADVDLTISPSIEIAVSPATVLSQDLIPYRAPCADSPVPSIVPSPDGTFLFNNPNLLISLDTLSTTPVIKSIPFRLQIPSRVLVQVQYEFLVSELRVNISGMSNDYEAVSVSGTSYRNLNVINDDLPAGSYTLMIVQPGDVIFNYGNAFPHCSTYALRISIKDANSDNTHVDCSNYAVLPWDLNVNGGGSVPYGGPIDRSGSIHLVGDKFLVPEGTNPKDTIVFNVVTPSLLTIVTKHTAIRDITTSVARGNGFQLFLNPVNTVSAALQRATQFYLDRAGSHELNLNYQGVTRLACPNFGMQFLMEPVTLGGNRTVCDAGVTPNYPTPIVIPGTSGTFYERLESVFDSPFIAQNMVNGQFRYTINITTTMPTRLITNLAFNSLSSLFTLRLIQTLGGGITTVGNGEYRMQRIRSGATNLNQFLTATLRAGRYQLQINSVFNTPYSTGAFPALCHPYIFSLLLIPSNNSVPILSSVSPLGGEYLSTSQPLIITVEFSVPVYDSQVVPISPANIVAVQNAFLLTSSSGNIQASSATQINAQQYSIVFVGPFASSTSYLLNLAPTLKDSRGTAFSAFGSYIYTTIDTGCSGRGDFDRGYCFCDSGYAGRQCETCEVGYKYRILNNTAWDCAKCLSPHCACLSDTCSCEPGVSPCKPLGTCSEDAQGNAVCSCQTGFAGSNCQACDSGYVGYPYCDKEKVCPPGTIGPNCDPIKNTGKNYAGLEVMRYVGLAFSLALLLVTIAFIVLKRFLGKKTSSGSYGELISE